MYANAPGLVRSRLPRIPRDGFKGLRLLNGAFSVDPGTASSWSSPSFKDSKIWGKIGHTGNPALWNSLPNIVTNEYSLKSFAKKLKTYLFDISFKCNF